MSSVLKKKRERETIQSVIDSQKPSLLMVYMGAIVPLEFGACTSGKIPEMQKSSLGFYNVCSHPGDLFLFGLKKVLHFLSKN